MQILHSCTYAFFDIHSLPTTTVLLQIMAASWVMYGLILFPIRKILCFEGIAAANVSGPWRGGVYEKRRGISLSEVDLVERSKR